MRRLITLALSVCVVWLIQAPAYADWKCGDAPFAFNQKDLIVTWVGPMPAQGKVSFTDGKIFREMAEVAGPEIPKYFPEKYVRGLRDVDIFNASMSWTVEELTRLQKRYEIPMEQEPINIFKEYISSGHTIISVLVEHPKVIDPSRYLACSVVLQRGVIVYDGGQETLFLRSYFHSAKDPENFVNFVPRGGIKVTFSSDTIWFPLKLTKVIFEPASYVVLDILTQEPLNAEQLPTPFRVETADKLAKYQGKEFYVTRISAKLESNKDWADLRLKPPGLGLKSVTYTPRIVPPGEISAVAMLGPIA